MARGSRPLVFSLMLCWAAAVLASSAQDRRAPKIWDDAALAEWATPVAGLNVRPGHYAADEYYRAPVDNFQTYPIYPPDAEPPGYWEKIQQLKPAPLVEAGVARSEKEWITIGARVFFELDAVPLRVSDPAVITRLRDPATFAGVTRQQDGSVFGPRWVITGTGLAVTGPACTICHRADRADTGLMIAGPGGSGRGGPRVVLPDLPVLGQPATARRLSSLYPGASLLQQLYLESTTPWVPDERIERLKTMTMAEAQSLVGPNQFGRSFANGVFSRTNGSPYFATKIMDLQNLRDSRYMDATATHRLRGPEDVARYAALVTGADKMDFGPHRILNDAQRQVRYRYADDVLYAIGVYLLSLQPPRNPAVADDALVREGEQVFRRTGCAVCHAPPSYTSGQLTLAQGWTLPPSHPNAADVLPRTAGTDPGLALQTRKGTGFYKIPSLRGLWYRPRLLHDGSLTRIEDVFDPARLSDDYEPQGWRPPGVTLRAVRGHEFGMKLSAEDKAALLAFLRTL